MLGVLVNTFTVILGSLIGLILKKGIPERFSDAVMKGIGICTLYIGISGALEGQNVLIAIASIVIGAIIGTLIDIDKFFTNVGEKLEKKFQRNDGKTSVAQGFVTGSLLFCVGAMTIVGSLNSGISGDHEMIFTKSLLDFISSMMLSVSLGIGVMFAAAFVFVFQGAIVLLAGFLQPVLTMTNSISEITCVGSLMIIMLGFNIIGLTKFKVANYLPGIVIAPIICALLLLFK